MKNKLLVMVILVIVVGTLYFLWHPTCVPVSQEDLRYISTNHYTPLEKRTDTAWGIKIWQQKNGQWYQCKAWFDRAMFS